MISFAFIDEWFAMLPNGASVQVVRGKQPSFRAWTVEGKTVAWERPLSKKDLVELGGKAPQGLVVAVHMVDLVERDAWCQTVPDACFVSQHFMTYPAVLLDLELANDQLVREVLDAGVEAVLGAANRRKR